MVRPLQLNVSPHLTVIPTQTDEKIITDALTRQRVLDRDLTEAPATPTDGDAYIIAANATGIWSGYDGFLAVANNNSWVVQAPQAGWNVYIVDEDIDFHYNGTDFIVVARTTTLSKSFQLNALAGTETHTIWRTPVAITITKIVSGIQAGGTDLTWKLYHSADRSDGAAGNAVITATSTTSSDVGGDVITAFDDATIPAGSWIYFIASAKTGSPANFYMSIEYTED